MWISPGEGLVLIVIQDQGQSLLQLGRGQLLLSELVDVQRVAELAVQDGLLETVTHGKVQLVSVTSQEVRVTSKLTERYERSWPQLAGPSQEVDRVVEDLSLLWKDKLV